MRRYELQSIRKKTKRRIFRTAALTLTMGLFLTGCGSREANSGSEQGNAESVAEGAHPNAVNLAAGVKAKGFRIPSCRMPIEKHFPTVR